MTPGPLSPVLVSPLIARLALAVLISGVSASCVPRAGQVPSRAEQSAAPTGPSGGYNQRDLDVARPFGGRAQAAVARALEGSVDIHMHTHPDIAERPVDAFEAADLAHSYGLRAIVLKNHYQPTAAQASLVREVVSGVEGGFGRLVWMPTYDAEAVVRRRQSDQPFAPVSRNGELLPETKAVISVIAEYGLVLATGHVSPEEGLMLVREGRRQGVEHVVVTHAMDSNWTVPQMREAANMGAFIEWAKPLGGISIDEYAEGIRLVGPEFTILSQVGVSHLPPELVGAFVVALLERGFTDRELDRMMKENPARLLGLSVR